MPRLSLYRPEKGNDYKFLDRNISEMFQIGGTDLYFHKYIGPLNTPEGESTPERPHYASQSETNIQDLLFLENRDRKYDSSIYTLRGIYNVADIDFNLSQFGLWLDNDTLTLTVHINDTVKLIGRKPLSGDVIELPHLRDEFALNNFDTALPRFYVIEDVGRASEGFSRTWYPHLYRLKLKKITDSQQYADILKIPTDKDANFVGDYSETTTYQPGEIVRFQGGLYTVLSIVTGTEPPDTTYYMPYVETTIRDILSTQNKALEINDAIISEAEENTPKSGYETRQFFTLAANEEGKPALITADDTLPPPDASSTTMDASRIMERPIRTGYAGYMLGDGVPDNGVQFGFGGSFPQSAVEGDYFLRTDYVPNRLFRYTGKRWIKREDNVRHTLTNTDTRKTRKTSFINNTNVDNIGGTNIEERQPISKALKPKADL
jgi:hypothetical protein